jgi:hypothetical protein
MAAEIKTLREFKARAEALFWKANPQAAHAYLRWVRANPVKRWANGKPGFSGTIEVRAAGYRPTNMIATYVRGDGLGVR